MPQKKAMPKSLLEASRRLRREMTPAERRLWESLRNRQLAGVKSRSQYVIGRYIADFYCHEYRLIIEVDGDIHKDRGVKENDQERQTNLEAEGYHILRFRNDQVEQHLESVLNAIRDWLESAPPRPPGEGVGA